MHKGRGGFKGESGKGQGGEGGESPPFDSIPPPSFLGRPEKFASLLQNKERIHVWLLTMNPGRIEWSLTIQLADMHLRI